MKAIVFNARTAEDLQSAINEFLEGRIDIDIEQVVQSESEKGGITLTVFYTQFENIA